MADDTQIDRWLCAVRLVKTRPMATQLCEGGHVRVNGNPAKPSTKVRAGDVVQALIAERERIVEVVRPIETRVGAPVAATCYVDNSPPPVIREIAPGIKAVRGEGRPSKRLRRELERMRRAGRALNRYVGSTPTVRLTYLIGSELGGHRALARGRSRHEVVVRVVPGVHDVGHDLDDHAGLGADVILDGLRRVIRRDVAATDLDRQRVVPIRDDARASAVSRPLDTVGRSRRATR